MTDQTLSRRTFLTSSAALATSIVCAESFALLEAPGAEAVPITYKRLPRWRGFNLQEKFQSESKRAPFSERDFELIAHWQFNFVRLPLDYRCWTTGSGAIDESVMHEIDQAVEWGRQRKIHVNLNLHRAPGYCINDPHKGSQPLWQNDDTGERARKQFAEQWSYFAQRYASYSNDHVSFNLINEPDDHVTESAYRRALVPAIDAIREISPKRLLIVDGMGGGSQPVSEFASLKVAQSQHCYSPFELTHYKANWFPGSSTWPVPKWPFERRGKVWNADSLRQTEITNWKQLQSTGIGIHIGEFGVYNRTPHQVTLAWMKDQLALFRGAGWGWALWELHGAFGPLDSERQDVEYEQCGPYKLDRKMYELLIADGSS